MLCCSMQSVQCTRAYSVGVKQSLLIRNFRVLVVMGGRLLLQGGSLCGQQMKMQLQRVKSLSDVLAKRDVMEDANATSPVSHAQHCAIVAESASRK